MSLNPSAELSFVCEIFKKGMPVFCSELPSSERKDTSTFWVVKSILRILALKKTDVEFSDFSHSERRETQTVRS